MSHHTTVTTRNHRLIDFIFQDSPEDQFEGLGVDADLSGKSSLWSRLVDWVHNN